MTSGLKIKDSTDPSAPTRTAALENVTIPVTGMTCAACQSFLQRELSNQVGVRDATVNLMLHNATVAFDPGTTSIPALVASIRGTGYGAELPVERRSALEEQNEHDEAQSTEYRKLRIKALISLIAGGIAMLLSMPLMTMSSSGGIEGMRDPLMSWNMR